MVSLVRFVLPAAIIICTLIPPSTASGESPETAHPSAPIALHESCDPSAADYSGFEEPNFDLKRHIEDGQLPNTHAVLIEHAGCLIFEEYFEGMDEQWGRPPGHRVFGPESLHDLRSVSKSVTSALLGIALGGDFEKALNTPVTAFFEDLEIEFGSGLEEVTLQHVLTMTAGIDWDEKTIPYDDPENDERKLYATRDPLAMVLSRPVASPPGGVWVYSSGMAQVLAGIVERKTGQAFLEFADEALFDPLGITRYEWLALPHWRPKGMPVAGGSLRLRARDLAKIGSLFLHKGVWNKKQIIPSEWVELSTRVHVSWIRGLSHGIYGYGFQWWPGKSASVPSYPIIAAVGNGGQRLFILPEQELVVTVLAGNYGRSYQDVGHRMIGRIVAASRAPD